LQQQQRGLPDPERARPEAPARARGAGPRGGARQLAPRPRAGRAEPATSRGRPLGGPRRGTRAMTPADLPASDMPGRVVHDEIVPACSDWSGIVPAQHVLRIVDLEGRQAVDFLCYSAADPTERYNAADTMKFAKTIFLTTGHGLYSGLGRRFF